MAANMAASCLCGILLLAMLLGAVAAAASASPEDAVFVPGSIPKDTNGHQVHAHGGGVLQWQSKFYWYGESEKLPPAWLSDQINLYSSPDLVTWTFEGAVLKGSDIRGFPFPAPFRIERPKIIYNDAYGYWVVWFHLDTPSFGWPSVGVAKADKLTGPWTWMRSFKPDGLNSYDMTLYKDETGAYLVRSVENAYLGITRLAPDYLGLQGGICSRAPRGEGPAIFRTSSDYFIFASHLTGWDPNPPLLFRRPGLCGETWVEMPPPATGPGAETTFNSQSTFVFPYRFANGEVLYIYMGDRWNNQGPGSVGAASYVWLPLDTLTGRDSFQLKWQDQWRLRDYKPSVRQQLHQQSLGSLQGNASSIDLAS